MHSLKTLSVPRFDQIRRRCTTVGTQEPRRRRNAAINCVIPCQGHSYYIFLADFFQHLLW